MGKLSKHAAIAFFTVAVGQASAQEYLKLPKLDLGTIFWHVDEESVAKVGNTIFFDGFVNPRPADLLNAYPGRGAVTCDGTTYYRIAEAWPQHHVSSVFELKDALDNRTSLETRTTESSVPREAKTPQFRARLASLCKTAKRPDRELFMVLSKSGAGLFNLGRMSTYNRVNTNTVDIWIDEVKQETFRPLQYRDGQWIPAEKDDGNPDYANRVKTDRSGAVRWRIDCARQRFAFLSAVNYSDKGNVVDSKEQRPESLTESSWSQPIPDSVGDKVILTVCKL